MLRMHFSSQKLLIPDYTNELRYYHGTLRRETWSQWGNGSHPVLSSGTTLKPSNSPQDKEGCTHTEEQQFPPGLMLAARLPPWESPQQNISGGLGGTWRELALFAYQFHQFPNKGRVWSAVLCVLDYMAPRGLFGALYVMSHSGDVITLGWNQNFNASHGFSVNSAIWSARLQALGQRHQMLHLDSVGHDFKEAAQTRVQVILRENG